MSKVSGEIMEIKGVLKKIIYNRDNYYVGLIRIKEADEDIPLDKMYTFTGFMQGVNIEDNLKMIGKFITHEKYGNQFAMDTYEVMLPSEKDGIVSFLSSDMFPGIGEGKAQKIYDKLGIDTINIILNDKDKLKEIKGITKKDINILYTKLLEYQDVSDTIIKLNDLGFNTKDSTSLYNKYKSNTLNILNDNIYDVIDTSFTFKKIDLIALKNNYQMDDIRRVKAGIIYVINTVNFELGDTYLLYNEIYSYLIRAINTDISFSLYEEAMNELINEKKVIINNDKYYLDKMYQAESNIAKRFSYLNNKKSIPNKNIRKIYDKIIKYTGIFYNEKQEEAILSAFSNNFMIITGGPGTGKTTIIKAIIKIYEELYKKSFDGIEDRVTLLAPTGRAAKRMMEAVGFRASTIHSFLKWNMDNDTFSVNEHNKVKTDVLIIDEASMIDTYLMDSLLKGIYYDTKIILVGDYHQLPSVGPGDLLKDLILSKNFLTIELNILYRAKENSHILTLADNIRNKIFDKSIFNVSSDLTFIPSDSNNLIDNFIDICERYKNYPYNDIAILAPMYKTRNGIDKLNLIAREIINPYMDQNEIIIGDIKYYENDKVILLVNMPDFGVYNGDIGIIDSIDNLLKEIYIDFDGNIVKFTKKDFYNFRHGYVMSIHKAQGSEYKVVMVIMLNEYKRMLYKKLLYTGVTRCKERLYLIGEETAITECINNDYENTRRTTLLERVKELNKD